VSNSSSPPDFRCKEQGKDDSRYFKTSSEFGKLSAEFGRLSAEVRAGFHKLGSEERSEQAAQNGSVFLILTHRCRNGTVRWQTLSGVQVSLPCLHAQGLAPKATKGVATTCHSLNPLDGHCATVAIFAFQVFGGRAIEVPLARDMYVSQKWWADPSPGAALVDLGFIEGGPGDAGALPAAAGAEIGGPVKLFAKLSSVVYSGAFYQATSGVVSSWWNSTGFLSTTPAFEGASGAGAFADGKVVGICAGGVDVRGVNGSSFDLVEDLWSSGDGREVQDGPGIRTKWTGAWLFNTEEFLKRRLDAASLDELSRWRKVATLLAEATGNLEEYRALRARIKAAGDRGVDVSFEL
jgi:hypothetical protein